MIHCWLFFTNRSTSGNILTIIVDGRWWIVDGRWWIKTNNLSGSSLNDTIVSRIYFCLQTKHALSLPDIFICFFWVFLPPWHFCERFVHDFITDAHDQRSLEAVLVVAALTRATRCVFDTRTFIFSWKENIKTLLSQNTQIFASDWFFFARLACSEAARKIKRKTQFFQTKLFYSSLFLNIH